MDFFETLESRHSVRAFLPKPLAPETVKRLLEAANRAPSAGDLQAYRISLVRGKAAKAALVSAALDQDFIASAPVVFVFSADKNRSAIRYGERGYELYAVQDATIAAAYCQLAAAALGLGSVWVGAFDSLEVSRIIRAGEHELPVAIIPVGHPAGNPEKSGRREIKELVREL